jgi:hypothetical protein
MELQASRNSSPVAAALESTDGGKRQLEKLREQAATEIDTSRTWINLRHVVTISKPRVEFSDDKLNSRLTVKE